MNPPPLLPNKPPVFDGFGFFVSPETQEVVFNYFDDMSHDYGQLPGNPATPSDRECYHVVLSSVRKGRVHIEHPFTSYFLDAFVYAKHVAFAGFTGIMIRETQYSLAILETTLVEMFKYHIASYGFVMKDMKGADVFYAGDKRSNHDY